MRRITKAHEGLLVYYLVATEELGVLILNFEERKVDVKLKIKDLHDYINKIEEPSYSYCRSCQK